MKVVDDEEFLAALEKNGYRRANGVFIQIKKEVQKKYTRSELDQLGSGYMLPKDNEDVYAACALGQASINLGIPAQEIALKHIYKSDIYALNDTSKYSIKRIAKELRKRVVYYSESRLTHNI